MLRWRISRGRLNQTILAIIANLGGMCYGIAESWSSPALPVLMAGGTPLPPITEEEASWIGSLLFLGPLVSTPICGYLVDKIGRKKTGYIVAMSFLIGWIVKYFAQHSALLLVGRFIMGLSSGGGEVLAPAYVGDIAQDDIRGALASLFEMFINVGILFVYIVGAYLSYQQLAIACSVIPLIFLIGLFCMPESPIYLIRVSKHQEAVKSLRWLRDGDDAALEEELSYMKKLVYTRQASASENTPSVKDILLSRTTRRCVITALSLVVIQNMSGIVAILSYTSIIFKESRGSIPPNISAIFVGVVQLVGSFVSTGVIDRFGRRFLTIVSNAGMSLCLALLFAYFLVKSYDVDVTSFHYIPVICLCVYIFFYALGMGPIPFVILSEVISPEVQGLVSSIILFLMWCTAFLVAKTFSIIASNLGIYSVFALYLLFTLTGVAYGYFFLIETKNKSLETILKELGQERKDTDNNIRT